MSIKFYPVARKVKLIKVREGGRDQYELYIY